MIPLRDVIPSRTTPGVTISLIVLNVLIYLLGLMVSDRDGFIYTFGLVPAYFSLINVLTYAKDGKLHSRIVPWFGPGAVVTTPRHHVDVIVTEYGAAELEGLTVRQRGEALAAIAHPLFRDELLYAAERAAHGRSPVA